MEEVFAGLINNGVLVYIDDILIYAKSVEEHLYLLEQVMIRCLRYNLWIKGSKSHICRSELNYLGFRLQQNGVHVQPDKVEGIRAMPNPSPSCAHLHTFLGMVSFYNRHIPGCAVLMAPLFDLMTEYRSALKGKGRKPVKHKDRKDPPPRVDPQWRDMWKDVHTESVDRLKSAVMNAALLAHPDYKKPFILYTDASTVGLGAALHQEQDDGLEAPLAYYSKKLVGAARRYPPIELEANAVLFGLEKCRPLTRGCTIVVKTDHRPLQYIANIEHHTNPRLERWATQWKSCILSSRKYSAACGCLI